MAQQGALATGQDRGEAPPVGGGPRMADGIGSSQQPVQPSRLYGSADRGIRISQHYQLGAADDPMLIRREPPKVKVLSQFPPHTGDKGDRSIDSPPSRQARSYFPPHGARKYDREEGGLVGNICSSA
jgi:hypothetical protein